MQSRAMEAAEHYGNGQERQICQDVKLSLVPGHCFSKEGGGERPDSATLAGGAQTEPET